MKGGWKEAPEATLTETVETGDADGDRYRYGDGDGDGDGYGDRYGDAASRAHPSLHQVLDASAIIGIDSSALGAVSDLIRLTCFNLIRLTWFQI